MADCDDPELRERISGWLIPIGCWIMEFIRGLRRPGAFVAACLIVALAIVGTMKELDWPKESWWEPGSVGQWVFIALYIATSILSFLVVTGYRRLLARPNRAAQFRKGSEGLVKLVTDTTSLDRHEVGANIWLVKGMWGFRRLVRVQEASISEPRNPTPITWTKGKGIIGEAWARNRLRFADLDKARAAAQGEAGWCSLPREQRFRLSWAEFSETARYHCVLAIPLRKHKFGRYRVRGVAAIDVLVPNRADELEGIQNRREFSAIRFTCEAAFAGHDQDTA